MDETRWYYYFVCNYYNEDNRRLSSGGVRVTSLPRYNRAFNDLTTLMRLGCITTLIIHKNVTLLYYALKLLLLRVLF